MTENTDEARVRLGALRETDGRRGVAQRAEKGRLQNAKQASPSSAPAAADDADAAGAPLAGGQAGSVRLRDLEDKEVVAEGLRNIGAKSFYRRASDQRWVDSTVTEEMEKDAQQIVQFSDDYFALASKHGKKLSAYLAFEEPVILNLDGKAYIIDPPK